MHDNLSVVVSSKSQDDVEYNLQVADLIPSSLFRVEMHEAMNGDERHVRLALSGLQYIPKSKFTVSFILKKECYRK